MILSLLAVLSWHFNWTGFAATFFVMGAAIAASILWLALIEAVFDWIERRLGTAAGMICVAILVALFFALAVGIALPAHSAVLSWTAPAFHADPGACSGASVAITEPETAYVYRQRQSPTLVAMAPAMRIDPAVWATYWPTVRAEAEPALIATRLQTPGRRDSIAISDTLGWFYRVESGAGSGRSCTAWILR